MSERSLMRTRKFAGITHPQWARNQTRAEPTLVQIVPEMRLLAIDFAQCLFAPALGTCRQMESVLWNVTGKVCVDRIELWQELERSYERLCEETMVSTNRNQTNTQIALVLCTSPCVLYLPVGRGFSPRNQRQETAWSAQMVVYLISHLTS
eukprot:2977341-Rhodomonas_salina.3